MQYRRKRYSRVYTARARRSGAMKALVALIFAVALVLLMHVLVNGLVRPVSASQVLDPGRFFSGGAQFIACDFRSTGI